MPNDEIQVLDLSVLDVKGVEEILEHCLDGQHKPLDEMTLCVWDIHSYPVGDYRSVIIQHNGRMYKSPTSSNKLVKDFAKLKNSCHEMTYLVASALEIHKKVPYVIGERCLIPTDGYTKAPTTWIVLNNVVHASYNRQKKQVHLASSQSFVLTIQMSKSTFELQLERAARILQYKLALSNDYLQEYSYCFQEPRHLPSNILLDTLKNLPYKKPTQNYMTMAKKIYLHTESKRIKEVLGEGNPYYEDYLAYIKEDLA